MANGQSPPGPGPFGPYWLERRIAVGGSAEVFLARRGGPSGAPLVIKRPLAELLEESPALFAEEARLHRLVRHPNVVEVHEAGEIEGEPYLAMQYVDGVDAFRLLRRAHAEEKRPPESLGLHVGLALCEALEAVHGARDEAGNPLGLVHRDVTPSNVYLSAQGEVLLGDFGIALPAVRNSRPQLQSSALKGKHNYLAPEQVRGEPSDHRADLFSCAVVITELLLGKPLFAGAGQVAVLLSIRDGRIDALQAAARRLPAGLLDVLSRALAREPSARYPSARALALALRPFAASPDEGRAQLREWVAWARDARGLARRLGGAILESEARIRKHPPTIEIDSVRRPPSVRAPAPLDLDIDLSEPISQRDAMVPPPSAVDSQLPSTRRQENPDELVPASAVWSEEPTTARIDEVPSRIRFADGRTLSPVRFARLIEMVVTGELGPDDEVDLMGQGFRAVAAIDLLERHLPHAASTRNVQAPAQPDDSADLAQAQLLPLLGRLARARATGLLLIEGRSATEAVRREVYLQAGHLLHVASSEPGDLLGQSLVRRGLISAAELDMALAILPRHHGRLGDTLIALGLVDAVTLFQAIGNQGRERFLKAFACSEGSAHFFRGAQPARVEFPQEIPLPQLILEGLEQSYPNDAPIAQSRAVLGRVLRTTPDADAPGALELLPTRVQALLRAVGPRGIELRHALARLAAAGEAQPADALRAMYLAIAMGFCEVT